MIAITTTQSTSNETSVAARAGSCPWTHVKANHAEVRAAANPWVGKFNRRKQAREEELPVIDFNLDAGC